MKYISHHSVHFVKKLQRILKDKNCKLKHVFTVDKVKNYFSLKCKTPLGLQSSVIYQFTCSVDPSISYVGRTSRSLIERVVENGRLSAGQCRPAIERHRLQCTCNCSIDKFKVLESCTDSYQLSICEALYIKA